MNRDNVQSILEPLGLSLWEAAGYRVGWGRVPMHRFKIQVDHLLAIGDGQLKMYSSCKIGEIEVLPQSLVTQIQHLFTPWWHWISLFYFFTSTREDSELSPGRLSICLGNNSQIFHLGANRPGARPAERGCSWQALSSPPHPWPSAQRVSSCLLAQGSVAFCSAAKEAPGSSLRLGRVTAFSVNPIPAFSILQNASNFLVRLRASFRIFLAQLSRYSLWSFNKEKFLGTYYVSDIILSAG